MSSKDSKDISSSGRSPRKAALPKKEVEELKDPEADAESDLEEVSDSASLAVHEMTSSSEKNPLIRLRFFRRRRPGGEGIDRASDCVGEGGWTSMRVLDSDAESWDDEDIEGAGCDEAARIIGQ
jgi:hypothetical protein